jgi:hypothetical protein
MDLKETTLTDLEALLADIRAKLDDAVDSGAASDVITDLTLASHRIKHEIQDIQEGLG